MKAAIIIDGNSLEGFNYTFKSINKVVGCKFLRKNYTQKEICELLKQFCMILDLTISKERAS